MKFPCYGYMKIGFPHFVNNISSFTATQKRITLQSLNNPSAKGEAEVSA